LRTPLRRARDVQLYLLDGARLRELREEAGLSPEELSEAVGQRKNWVRELEQQSRVHVLELFMHRLVDALGVGIPDMTAFPEPPAPPIAPEAQKLDTLRLRALREEMRISRGELDEAAELEPGSVAQAEEAGEGIYASVEVIWKLARALEVSPTVLLKR
jgi:transcriptional regulator with XRE-family HTH domain